MPHLVRAGGRWVGGVARGGSGRLHDSRDTLGTDGGLGIGRGCGAGLRGVVRAACCVQTSQVCPAQLIPQHPRTPPNHHLPSSFSTPTYQRTLCNISVLPSPSPPIPSPLPDTPRSHDPIDLPGTSTSTSTASTASVILPCGHQMHPPCCEALVARTLGRATPYPMRRIHCPNCRTRWACRKWG
mgnify:CR=1 FL=1